MKLINLSSKLLATEKPFFVQQTQRGIDECPSTSQLLKKRTRVDPENVQCSWLETFEQTCEHIIAAAQTLLNRSLKRIDAVPPWLALASVEMIAHTAEGF